MSQGFSITSVAYQLGLSKGTVYKYKKVHLPNLSLKKAGCLSILTDCDKSRIRHNILTGVWKSAAKAHAALTQEGYHLSDRTLHSALRSIHFRAVKKIKKPYLSVCHKKACYEWVKVHQYWTLDDWQCVVFSDKTKINVWGSDKYSYY